MIPFLLANWRWLIPTASLAVSLGWGGIQHMELLSERAARAEERVAAAKFATEAAQKARQKDNDNANLARDLDAVRVKADQDISSGRAAFDQRLADVLRARRSVCRNSLPASPANPGAPETASDRSDNGPGAADSGARLRELVKSLQADVQECVAWANKVGR